MALRLIRTVLQVSGIEFIVLGFLSWLAALWTQNGQTPDQITLSYLVALADLSQALTSTPPYIALTILGILLIVSGTALRWLNTNG